MKWKPREHPNIERNHQLGARLSIEIGCPVRYPAYDKGLFECACEITFPSFMLEGDRWDEVKKIHKEGKS